MTEVKKGIGKAKIGLLTSAVLVVMLAVSSVWLYTRVDSLQDQVESLQDQVDSLLGGVHIFQYMPDATLSQINPAGGTKYTVLDTTENARILGIGVKCVWTVMPTFSEIYLTIDGQSLVASKRNPANNTWYTIYWSEPYENPSLESGVNTKNRAFFVEGRSIKIEAGVIGGPVTHLDVKVKYAIIP